MLCQKPAYFCFANTTAVFLPFLYCFCPLPLSFAFGTFRPLPFEILPVVFLFSVVSFAVFLGRYSLFFNVCVFQQPFSYLFVYCLLPLCLLPFAIWAFCSLPFGSLLVCLFSVVSFAVFLGQSSLFFNVCVFQQPFSYLFYIVFCPFALLPFAIWDISPFALWNFARCFLILGCFIRCLFGAVFAFRNVCLFQQRLSYLFYIVFCPLPLSFAFETFCALPFSILQTAFCPLLPPFVVFFLFCVWDSPFALLLTAICCKNLLLDKKFSKNKKSLEIVIKTFDNT